MMKMTILRTLTQETSSDSKHLVNLLELSLVQRASVHNNAAKMFLIFKKWEDTAEMICEALRAFCQKYPEDVDMA